MAVDARALSPPPDPVDMLCRLVAIPSPTGQEEAAASYLVEAMRALGLKAGLDAASS